MACEDQISTEDLENGKTDITTISEVATSREGGVSTGTLIDSTQNRFNETISTLRGQLAKLGYEPPVAYAGSIVFGVNDNTNTIDRDGIVYAPLPSELPFTTTGTWTADDENKFFVAQSDPNLILEALFKANYADVRAIDVSTITNGQGLTVTNTGIGGDFVLRNVVAHGLADNGGTIIVIDSDWYAERIDLEGFTTLEQFQSTAESGIPVTDSTAEIAAAISDADINLKWLTDRGGNNYLASGIDLANYNLGRFKMSGIDNTQFYASENIASGPFLDCGWDASDTTHPSNIQFADVTGLSIRSNGNTLNYGASFDQFRRGYAGFIRAYGSESADELENGFKYNYSWVANFDKCLSQNHYGSGHEFGTSSLNAVTFTNLSAASSRTTAENYTFNGSNSVVLISPNSEGAVFRGFNFVSNCRSITIVNPHIEGANSGFFKTGADNNGCSVTILGGACFSAPAALNFSDSLTDLNINGFCIYDIDAVGDLDIQINARTAIINNLTVLTSAKVRATEAEIINSITLGSNCERCLVNGVDIVGLKKFTSPAPKEFFNITINPGTPVELTSDYVTDMARRTVKVFAAQRTSSATIGHINSIVTVTEDQTIDQDSINIKKWGHRLTYRL